MIVNRVKKQHYVPRFYLRRFSSINNANNDKQNKISVFNKKIDKIYDSNVYNEASENYFYDIDNASTIQQQQIFETVLSKIESNFGIILKKMLDLCEEERNHFKSLIMTKAEREEFSFYITIQLLRTKKYREWLSDFNERAIESISSITNIEYTVNNKIMHLKTLCDDKFINALTGFLADSCWIFIKNETNIPFITSDNPIAKIPRLYKDNFYGTTTYPLFSDTLEIYYPLSTNVVLYIFRNETPNFYKFKNFKNRVVTVSDTRMVNIINDFQLIMSNEKIFIDYKYKYLLEDYKKYDYYKEKILII